MTPHPAADAAYWAVLSRNRIGDTATPERHREAIEAYMKERFKQTPADLERMSRALAEAFQAALVIGVSFELCGDPDFTRLLNVLAYYKTMDGKDLLPFPLLPNWKAAAQSARIAELEAEGFRLAANQCHRGYGGEYGDHCCRYQDRIAELDTEVARLMEALKIIAGEQQCLDNLMGNQDVARAAIQPQGL